ncbi:cellulose binding domain-containing protein [Actinoplanes sp. NPDC051513]|uniref:cellulose binding domain-containing protein n=1 Tax=Actinoplanes sp. NPDC051513 TaxID=3363908 RepID=UPI0037A296CF
MGVVALVAFTVVTIVRLLPGHATPRTLPPPEPPFTLPGTTSGVQAPISLVPSSPASPSGALTPSRTAPAVIRPPRETTAAPANVVGKYRVVESYGDSFIGEVLVTNRTSVPQNWVVKITYPGSLRTSWLESLPQPTLVQRANTFTWTSSVPLAAGSSGQLRFHFDRAGGSDTPDSCTVNGSPCS